MSKILITLTLVVGGSLATTEAHAAEIHQQSGVIMVVLTDDEVQCADVCGQIVLALTTRVPKPLPHWLAQWVAQEALARLVAENRRGGRRGAAVIVALTPNLRNLIPEILPAGKGADARFRELVAQSRAASAELNYQWNRLRRKVSSIVPW